MKTFDLTRPINGVGDLSDGVLIGLCLKNMYVSRRCSLEPLDRLVLVMAIISMRYGCRSFEQMPEIIIG